MAKNGFNFFESEWWHYNFKLALKNYLSALDIAERKSDKYDLATVYLSIGDVYTDLKDYKNAENYLNKGMTLAEEIGSQERIPASRSR